MSDDMVVIRELADMAAREIRLQERVRELEDCLREIIDSPPWDTVTYDRAQRLLRPLTAPSATGEGER